MHSWDQKEAEKRLQRKARQYGVSQRMAYGKLGRGVRAPAWTFGRKESADFKTRGRDKELASTQRATCRRGMGFLDRGPTTKNPEKKIDASHKRRERKKNSGYLGGSRPGPEVTEQEKTRRSKKEEQLGEQYSSAGKKRTGGSGLKNKGPLRDKTEK